MKKIYSVLLLAALCLGSTVQADELGPLYDGTNTSGEYVPLDGGYADACQRVQVIYPKSDLADMAGKNITKMTFYLTTKAAKEWGATFEIALAETSESNFDAENAYKNADFQIVYSGTGLSGMSDVMEIPFSDAFNYSGDNNLLFELRITKGGTYSKAKFAAKGGYDNNFSIYKNASSYASITSGNRKSVRPKTLFTYEDAPAGSETCAAPGVPVASELTATSAKLTWEAAESVTTYQYACVLKGAEVDWATATSTTELSVTLSDLTKTTDYDFYLRSYCDEEEQSAAKKVSFTTEESCFAPTELVSVEAETTSNSARITWSASGKGETQYQYTYAISGNAADWSKAVVADQAEATLTGLNPATSYQVWVRSYCSADDQSEAVTTYFTTKCGELTVDAANPWKENFDSQEEGDAPSCWEVVQAQASSSYFKVQVSSSISYSSLSSNALVIVNTNEGYGYAKFPEFTNALNTLQISFSHTDESDSYSGTIDMATL